MAHPIKSPRKLIEVALPLDAINVACAKEKSVRHGHPSTLHLWWARRPLAAARAVIFAQLVNDPGYQQGGGFKFGKNKREAAIERKRLFKIIEDLVVWENANNAELLNRARVEIRRSWREVCDLNKDHPQARELFNPEELPPLHDPFAGGGAIPIEAQRLGLKAYASDLNPVAVLINKAMIEIPPRFEGCAPVGPQPNDPALALGLSMPESWKGAAGLALDIRRYAAWMRAEAKNRIGHLYPTIEVTPQLAEAFPELVAYRGKSLTVIAWLWARTVRCPSPACSCEMPLISSFVLSSKSGRTRYLRPSIHGKRIAFGIQEEPPPDFADPSIGYKRGMSGVFECAFCGTVTTRDYVSAQALEKGLGSVQTAVVVEGVGGRVYLPAEVSLLPDALPAVDVAGLDIELAANPRDVWCRNFGLLRPVDLFTPRQLVTLTTVADLVHEVRKRAKSDAEVAGMPDDGKSLTAGGKGATAYADAIAVYCGFMVSNIADDLSSIVTWRSSHGTGATRSTFARQALPMVWDYAEANPFALAAGDLICASDAVSRVVAVSPLTSTGLALQADAAVQEITAGKVVSTDPPYYDNIGYADLSDFFYVWLRRSLRTVFPELFATVAAPKTEELVAASYRHGSREASEGFFLRGMTRAMGRIAEQSHPAFPVTVYYAFKQAESDASDGTASTGWDTFLDAVIRSGLVICGTWPMRTERGSRSVGIGTNVLASSIVLVCRRRLADAPSISRREFLRELSAVLPDALDEMTKGSGGERSPVAPVDLSQAIIGPGMAVFSKHSAVLEADGTPMSVRTALQLINRFLAEDDFDADTQFCLAWFEQRGWAEGAFGEADTLSRGKGTSVDGMKEAGVLKSGAGRVRLLKWSEYPKDWDPLTDARTPVWEALHQLIRALKQDGESASGALLAALGGKDEAVRQLAYRLYTLCERLGKAEDARAYNDLITSWTGIETAAASTPKPADPQGRLFES